MEAARALRVISNRVFEMEIREDGVPRRVKVAFRYSEGKCPAAEIAIDDKVVELSLEDAIILTLAILPVFRPLIRKMGTYGAPPIDSSTNWP